MAANRITRSIGLSAARMRGARPILEGMRGSRAGMCGVALAAAVLMIGGQPANAATQDGTASVGSATVVDGDLVNTLTPLAGCTVHAPGSGSTAGAEIPDVVSFGNGTSSCTRNTSANTTTSTATGARFQLTALQPYGGPRIRLANYTVSCTATTDGTSAGWSFSGLAGLPDLPQQIPADYTVPITDADGQLLANVIFNETILPYPNDGGITLNLMHIVLFPDGGPLSGDIYVGSTSCAPTF
jgi:hypothetical protein